MKWMIPAEIRDGDDPDLLEQATLVVSFARVIVMNAGGAFPLILYYFGSPWAGLYNLIIGVFIFFAPLVMRFASLTTACHVLLFLALALIQGLNIFMGGILAPPIPCIAIAPMAAVFLLGRRAGIFWVVGAILCILQLTAFEAFDWPLPHNPLTYGQMLFLRAAGLIALCISALAFMLNFNAIKQDAISVIQSGNQRLTKMVVHVEASSAALSRSAAEFLGNDGSDTIAKQIGLTQQMLTTATSGRDMVEQFRGSLRGMIAQYESISQQISDLHKQAANIADLVKIIDNISDRLDLMALNTGIEAAHAGESGKRFRLLADDMRRLAERVSFETTRIKAVIRQVQEHTDAAMESSTHGQSLTDEGNQRVETLSRAFDDIYVLIERTAEVSKRITQDMTNQIHAIRILANASLDTSKGSV